MALQNWTHCQIDGGGGGRSQEATNTIVYSRSPLSPPTHTRRGYYAATNTTVYIYIYLYYTMYCHHHHHQCTSRSKFTEVAEKMRGLEAGSGFHYYSCVGFSTASTYIVSKPLTTFLIFCHDKAQEFFGLEKSTQGHRKNQWTRAANKTFRESVKRMT